MFCFDYQIQHFNIGFVCRLQTKLSKCKVIDCWTEETETGRHRYLSYPFLSHYMSTEQLKCSFFFFVCCSQSTETTKKKLLKELRKQKNEREIESNLCRWLTYFSFRTKIFFFQPLNGTYIQFYIDRGLYDTRFRYNLCCITGNLLKIGFLCK